MLSKSFLLAALVAVAAASPAPSAPPGGSDDAVQVPQCPETTTVQFNTSVPDKTDFPLTKIDLCWADDASVHLTFRAFNETNFYFDPNQGTNDDIWEYEVMEAFIFQGEKDPQTYLEYEINPNNVTYQAFVYNPTKIREEGAPFDHLFVSDPAADGFSATTTLDYDAETWFSDAVIPLGLFNVESPRSTHWRMNFFRTITSPETFPEQQLGAWSVPPEANFHLTEYLGHFVFV